MRHLRTLVMGFLLLIPLASTSALAQSNAHDWTELTWNTIARSNLAHTQLQSDTSSRTVVRNVQAAYREVLAGLYRGQLTLEDVLRINGRMRAGGLEGGHVRDPGGGRLRTQEVAWYERGVRVHQFPTAQTVQGKAQELQAILSDVSSRRMSRGEAVQAAAKAHSLIAHEQLFSDGNHRTARAVADWVLMQQKLPPADYSAVGYGAYNGNFKLDLEEYTKRFEPVMDRAVRASEASFAEAGTDTLAGPAESASQARSCSAAGRPRPAPAARKLGSRVLGSAVQGVVFTAGLAGASEAASEVTRGEPLDGSKVLRAATNRATLAGGVGFSAGETLSRLAITAVASAIPVAGAGALLAKPLVTAALSGSVGVVSGGLAAHVVGGDGPLDVTDLVGSSVASGIGMAVGSALLPGVGTIAGGVLGGIVGGLAWEVCRSTQMPHDASSPAALTASAGQPSVPLFGTGPAEDASACVPSNPQPAVAPGEGTPLALPASPQATAAQDPAFSGLERTESAP